MDKLRNEVKRRHCAVSVIICALCASSAVICSGSGHRRMLGCLPMEPMREGLPAMIALKERNEMMQRR